MKHKTPFRLVLKAIGILLLGFSIPQAIELVLWAVWIFTDSSTGAWSTYDWLSVIGRPLGGFMQVGLALYLLIGGQWIVDRCIPSNRPYCPECGYDLSNSKADVCVECGVTLPARLENAARAEP